MVHDAGAARVGQKLRAVAKQSPRRNLVQKAHHSLPRILHLEHRGPPWTELLDDDAEEFLGDIDRELLVRLQTLAVRTLTRDHARTRHLKLVALASHRLHQNGEVELPAAGHGPRI